MKLTSTRERLNVGVPTAPASSISGSNHLKAPAKASFRVKFMCIRHMRQHMWCTKHHFRCFILPHTKWSSFLSSSQSFPRWRTSPLPQWGSTGWCESRCQPLGHKSYTMYSKCEFSYAFPILFPWFSRFSHGGFHRFPQVDPLPPRCDQGARPALRFPGTSAAAPPPAAPRRRRSGARARRATRSAAVVGPGDLELNGETTVRPSGNDCYSLPLTMAIEIESFPSRHGWFSMALPEGNFW